MDKPRRLAPPRKDPEIPADLEAIIAQLATSEASRVKSTNPDIPHSEEQLRGRFLVGLREQAGRFLPLFAELEDNADLEKLVGLGCDRATLIQHLGLALDIPKRATPAWEHLVSCSRLMPYLKRIGTLAVDIQLLISRGGLELVPEDLRLGIDMLPPLLYTYSIVLTHVRSATSKKATDGPKGLDSRALAQLARYVKESTGKPHSAYVIRLLDVASHGTVQIDPRVYRRFVKRQTDHASVDKDPTLAKFSSE